MQTMSAGLTALLSYNKHGCPCRSELLTAGSLEGTVFRWKTSLEAKGVKRNWTRSGKSTLICIRPHDSDSFVSDKPKAWGME